MTRRLPTILALPIMAVGIALIAGISVCGRRVQHYPKGRSGRAGAMRMSTAIAGLFFGGFFER